MLLLKVDDFYNFFALICSYKLALRFYNFSSEMDVSFFVPQREEIFTDGKWNLHIYPITDL